MVRRTSIAGNKLYSDLPLVSTHNLLQAKQAEGRGFLLGLFAL